MDFEQRLQKAIHRGQRRGDAAARKAAADALSEEEVKNLHTKYRLELSEYIESCIRRLPNHLPGFRYETIYGERGWGAACKRDDVRVVARGRRENVYTRLEMTIRPHSSLNVLELNAKGTVHNKELFNRQHYEQVVDADPATFVELIDTWVLEFAELYAANI